MAAPSRSRFASFQPILGLWLSFLACSLIRAPIPAVNEPHYLVKARHYWQPEWCRGDLFLESANPHVVFYQTIGWLPATLTFEYAALIGRILVLLLLAIGWDRLLSQILCGRWSSVAAAWLFLLLQACGNFAGEWLVGGVESKVVAYALVMWGCGTLLAGRLNTGGALLGAAVSFHPVVGAWCIICLAGAAVLRGIVDRRRPMSADTTRSLGPLIRNFVPAIGCGFACSLPGLIPAAKMLTSADPATTLRADILMVAVRLDHHLDPYMFPWRAYAYYAAMIVAWLIARRMVAATRASLWLDAFTWIAIAVAVLGWLAAAGPRPVTYLPWMEWRIKLLKLYPFRIADLAVPFTLAVSITQLASARIAGGVSLLRATIVAGGFAAAFVAALVWPGVDKNPSRMSPRMRADWIAALGWVAAKTPHDCVLWTPDEDWAVKWFAERPEYVNFKDCPQDARGTIDWYERRVLLAEWKRAAAGDGVFTAAEFADLHEKTGITHIVLSRMGPIEPPPVYQNGGFRVFALTDLEAESLLLPR